MFIFPQVKNKPWIPWVLYLNLALSRTIIYAISFSFEIGLLVFFLWRVPVQEIATGHSIWDKFLLMNWHTGQTICYNLQLMKWSAWHSTLYTGSFSWGNSVFGILYALISFLGSAVKAFVFLLYISLSLGSGVLGIQKNLLGVPN